MPFTDGFIDIDGDWYSEDYEPLTKAAYIRYVSTVPTDFYTAYPEASSDPSIEAYSTYLTALDELTTAQAELAQARKDLLIAQQAYYPKQRLADKLQAAAVLATQTASANPEYASTAAQINAAATQASQEANAAAGDVDIAQDAVNTALLDVDSETAAVASAEAGLVRPTLSNVELVFPDYDKLLLKFNEPVEPGGGTIKVTSRGEIPVIRITSVRSDVLELTLASNLIPGTKEEAFEAGVELGEGAVRNIVGQAGCLAVSMAAVCRPNWTIAKFTVPSPYGGDVPAWLAMAGIKQVLGFTYNTLRDLVEFDETDFTPPEHAILLGKLEDGALTNDTEVQANDDVALAFHIGGDVAEMIPGKAQGTIQVGAGVDIEDGRAGTDGFNVSSSEECAPLGSGGGGPVERVFAMVLGGNVVPAISTAEKAGQVNLTVPESEALTEPDEMGYVDTDYAANRSFSFPVPIPYQDGQVRLLPFVNRWDRYVLETGYSFGDSLPRLPDGLCWLRLVRPYSLGGRSWSANLAVEPTRSPIEDVLQVYKVTVGEKGDKVDKLDLFYVLPLRATKLALNETAEFMMQLTRSSQPILRPDNKPVGIDSIDDTTSGKLVIELDAEIETSLLVDAELIIDANVMTGLEVYLEVYQEDGTEVPLASNTGGSLTVQPYSSDSGTMVIGLNRMHKRVLGLYDIVELDATGVAITDRKYEIGQSSETKTVYDILGKVQ